jgi:penicillin-binding protein 1C
MVPIGIFETQPSDDSSRVLLDSEKKLVRVWLNEAGQYKFPADGDYAKKYYTAVTYFEDRRFSWHIGIDPIAVVRAIVQNIQAGKIKSGASTLTMQAARLRNPRNRTWWAKFVEAHTALRMELQWSKSRIFAEYASRAPMGGNVVGVETACWRFFGHGSGQMTWAEAALLALLPNRPSALNLARSRNTLLKRRNTLLQALFKEGHFDHFTLNSALAEPLPNASSPWKFRSPHYGEFMARTYPQKRLQGTLDPKIQSQVERLADLRGNALRMHSDVNISILVVETQTGKIRGYLGSLGYFDTLSQGMVDGVLARRSTGSTLKPFLFGLALERGPYTPNTLLLDVPTWYGGFSPQNSDPVFSGLVPMHEALARSLNAPAVSVLADYGVDEFHYWLQNAGLQLFRTPEAYGLPLILGGAEASLAELVPLYAMLMQDGVRTPLRWTESDLPVKADTLLSPAASYAVREMLTSVLRPDIDMYHAWFDHQVPVAWKTGTSYGARDGWAIGTNAQWTIGVWVGNFKGGGVPGLSGSGTAAPLLFSLFNTLTDRLKPMWKSKPLASYFKPVEICALSGFPATDACSVTVKMDVPYKQQQHMGCPYHQKIIRSKTSGHRVNSDCWDVADTVQSLIESWPATVRAQWRLRGIEPSAEPQLDPKCAKLSKIAPFSWIYPPSGSRIYIPQKTEVSSAGFIARVAHREPQATLQWFLDGTPVGETKGEHKLAITTKTGTHKLVVQDPSGRYKETQFSVRASETKEQ